MQIDIIVPTLNEAENIPVLLCEIEQTTVSFNQIIVVDDGSSDGTREQVQALAPAHRIRLLQRDGGRCGLAGAIIAGAQLSQADLLVVMDADLSHPPDKIAALLSPLIANQADLVVGSRYVRGGSTPGWPLWRRVLSRTASAIAYPLTGVRDSMCGFFAIRREALLRFAHTASGFKIAFQTITRGGDKLRVREIPIAFHDRVRGQSKMSLREALRFATEWVRALTLKLNYRSGEAGPIGERKLSHE